MLEIERPDHAGQRGLEDNGLPVPDAVGQENRTAGDGQSAAELDLLSLEGKWRAHGGHIEVRPVHHQAVRIGPQPTTGRCAADGIAMLAMNDADEPVMPGNDSGPAELVLQGLVRGRMQRLMGLPLLQMQDFVGILRIDREEIVAADPGHPVLLLRLA